MPTADITNSAAAEHSPVSNGFQPTADHTGGFSHSLAAPVCKAVSHESSQLSIPSKPGFIVPTLCQRLHTSVLWAVDPTHWNAMALVTELLCLGYLLPIPQDG
jgi:hypothetical protein